MPTPTLDDDDAWLRVGRDLKRLDPKRYLRVLYIAQAIVSAYCDPLGLVEVLGAEIGRASTDDLD